MRRDRLSAWLMAAYLMLALGFAGAHLHQDSDYEVDLKHKCVACLVVSDLDDASVPDSFSIFALPQKQVVLPQAPLIQRAFTQAEAKARAPPLNSL